VAPTEDLARAAGTSVVAAHTPATCDRALTQAFAFLGKRWSGMILAALGPGPVGFSQLRRTVQGISDSVLSERLAELCRAGLVARVVDEGPPVAVSYGLSDSGAALLPALDELRRWASAYLDPEVAKSGGCNEGPSSC
jgi:DNA-binding HxlR family transcriptional regulator